MRSVVLFSALVALSACGDSSGQAGSVQPSRHTDMKREAMGFNEANTPSAQCLTRWRDVATAGCRALIARHFEQDDQSEQAWQRQARELNAECAPPPNMVELRETAAQQTIRFLEGENVYGTSDEWCAFNVQEIGISQGLLPATMRTVSAPVDEARRREAKAYRQRVEEGSRRDEARLEARRAPLRLHQRLADMLVGRDGNWTCTSTWQETNDHHGAAVRISVTSIGTYAETTYGLYFAEIRPPSPSSGVVLDFIQERQRRLRGPGNFMVLAANVHSGQDTWTFDNNTGGGGSYACHRDP